MSIRDCIGCTGSNYKPLFTFDDAFLRKVRKMPDKFFDKIKNFFDPCGEILHMQRILKKGGLLFINNPIMDLDSELKYLKSESSVTDKIMLVTLRKSYHIDHLNYLTVGQFRSYLKKVGFDLKPVFEWFWNPGISGGYIKN
jgi:hypothetical protein